MTQAVKAVLELPVLTELLKLEVDQFAEIKAKSASDVFFRHCIRRLQS